MNPVLCSARITEIQWFSTPFFKYLSFYILRYIYFWSYHISPVINMILEFYYFLFFYTLGIFPNKTCPALRVISCLLHTVTVVCLLLLRSLLPFPACWGHELLSLHGDLAHFSFGRWAQSVLGLWTAPAGEGTFSFCSPSIPFQIWSHLNFDYR